MKRPIPLLLAAALSLLSGGFLSAQTVATDPVGFATINLAAESDSYISIPFTRPPEFVGAIQSVTTNAITVSGTPAWNSNQFVYAPGSQPKHYYVLIGSGGSSNPKEGHTFPVTANSNNTLTVDTTIETLSGITANTQVVLIPFWTLGTVFPTADANVSYTPTDSAATTKTLVRVPNDAGSGINLGYMADYFYSNNVDGTSSNVGWRKVGDANTTSHDDDVLLPDSYLVVRNKNGAPGLPLTTLGAVLLKKFTVPLRLAAGTQQDNPVSILRPLDVPLNMTGLNPTDGSFGADDQLLLFSNTQIGIDKAPAAIYYRDPANNFNWRLVGDNKRLDHGNDIIPLGTGIVVRKAPAGSAGNVFWTNTFPVQALSAVSRKQHGSVGTFDLNLPLTGTPAVESRNPGSGYNIIFTFPTAVTYTGASVTSGSGTLTNSTGSGSTQVSVNVTAVTQQFVTVTLAGVSDGVNTNDVSVTMGVLIGDANQNGTVNSGDALVIRNKSGQGTDATNFMQDFNEDGSVNSGDALIVRNRSGNTLFPN